MKLLQFALLPSLEVTASLQVSSIGETFKASLDGALSNLIQLKMSLLTAGGLDWMDFKGPFQPKPFYDVWKTRYLLCTTKKRTENKWRRLTQLVVKELPAVYLRVKHTMPSKQRFLEYWESWALAEQLGSPGCPPGHVKKM